MRLKLLHTFIFGFTLGVAQAQTQQFGPTAGEAIKQGQGSKPIARAGQSDTALDSKIQKALDEGIEVKIKDIARFRGVRANQLMGYGLVVGLEGSGDSKKTPFTATLLANALKRFGTMIDPKDIGAKNVATVAITAELPPFASPGNRIDVTVQSIGDATSLQGGILLQAPLYGADDEAHPVAVAQGAVSIGGFNATSGGASVQKNHVNVGRIPVGGFVEKAVPYQMVFENNTMFLELDDGDITTSERISEKLQQKFPTFKIEAVDGGTLQIQLPQGANAMKAMALIEGTTVRADIPAVITVNERTGTITISGNVKLGPAVIARGNLKITIKVDNDAVPAAPFAQNGTATPVTNTEVTAKEAIVGIGVVGPNASLNDLAKIFQKLKVSATDMIAILDQLKAQGALKAKIKVL